MRNGNVKQGKKRDNEIFGKYELGFEKKKKRKKRSRGAQRTNKF